MSESRTRPGIARRRLPLISIQFQPAECERQLQLRGNFRAISDGDHLKILCRQVLCGQRCEAPLQRVGSPVGGNHHRDFHGRFRYNVIQKSTVTSEATSRKEASWPAISLMRRPRGISRHHHASSAGCAARVVSTSR